MPPIGGFTTGVYQIRNTVNGKVYIGSASISLSSRMRRHKDQLRLGNHPNKHLQRSYNKYGIESFEFSIVQRCRPDLCLVHEQEWLDSTRAADQRYGFNTCPIAGNTLGVVHTDQARSNMRAAHLGVPLSKTHRDNLTAAVRIAYAKESTRYNVSIGTKKALSDPAIRQKMSDAGRGKTLTKEHKIKIGLAHLGKTHTESTRKKIGDVQRGRKLTESHKASISASSKGKTLTPEHAAKIKAAKRIKCRTPEFRAKMADVARKQWEKRRADDA